MANKIPHVIVLGGGISGLSLAYFLRIKLAQQAKITLLEQSSRTGGWIATKNQAGFIFEQGPRSCRAVDSKETNDLIDELNLKDQVVWASPDASTRYLFLDKKLTALPKNPLGLISSGLGRKLLLGCLNDLVQKKGRQEETVHQFFSRRFSPLVADIFADALVSGVYAADSRQVSLKSCFPKVYNYEQTTGSVVRGALASLRLNKSTRGLFSLRYGMETLITALNNQLVDNIKLHQTITKITLDKDRFFIDCKQDFYEADYIFSCLPASALAKIVPSFIELGAALEKITHTSVAVINFAFNHDVCPRGFGYLIPTCEGEKNLGVVWDSVVFSHLCQKNSSIVTVMIGQKQHHNFDQLREQDWIAMAKDCLRRQMGITDEPRFINVKIAHNAIPQYQLGHHDLVKRIEALCLNISPRLAILGSSFYGVSVNDCIKKSKSMAADFIDKFS